MKLSIALTLIMLHVPAAQSKATAKSNLRGSDSHVDDIISDESVDIIRQLDVSLTNTTDEDVDCHPYDLKWDELTSQQKDAARDLSYNRHKWDNDTLPDPSAIRHDYWIDAPSGETELTNRERNAAILLGYNEGSWEDFYVDYDWSELPTERSDNENVKAAAKDLGFNKTTWDTNLTIPTDYLDWANLTTSEQEAAMVLGYDECTWDRETLDDGTTM